MKTREKLLMRCTMIAMLLVVGVLVTASPHAYADQSARPNILVILSDDQGYADVGFQGCKDIPTPHLDSLARDGLRCTNGYVTHSFCSPSRAGLMTGRYQSRFGYEYNPKYNPNDHSQGVSVNEKFLPVFLKQAGYTTGWIGKWHLGAAPEFRPENRGFMETFGFIGGGHHFINWNPKRGVEYSIPIERNGRAVPVKEHLTVAFGQEAADFIRRHKTDPWFLYLAFHAPHTPNQPTAERLARFKGIKDKKRRAYAAQVSLMDDAVGAALKAINETGQKGRTLVFFFSDNGGPLTVGSPNGSCNVPLRDGKGSVYEGGVRVPFVVSWPGHLPAGKDYDHPVISLDVFPTAMACAGVAMPNDRPYDGTNLLPFLSGQKAGSPHKQLFWRMGNTNKAAFRDGSNKLVRNPEKPEELFNLGNDRSESRNLASSEPKILQSLHRTLESWFQQIAKDPAFNGEGPEKEQP